MNQEVIMSWIAAAWGNPFVQVAIALIIVKLVPKELWAKVPIIGPSVQAFLNAWALKKLKDFDFQRDVMEKEAERTVRAKEQDIKNGKIDAVTAKAQATQEMVQQFNLPPAIADKLIEASVNKLPSEIEIVAGKDSGETTTKVDINVPERTGPVTGKTKEELLEEIRKRPVRYRTE